MDNMVVDVRQKIRQQFDTGPYPRIPLEASPKKEPKSLYIHNLVNSYYLRRQKIINTKDKLILDAGCGSGYKSLVLAQANPGAKIVGVDISEKSIELARQRLQHHRFDNTDFHVISIEDLPQLGLEFNYINCDDVLYLLPEPVVGLQAMKSVLKPDGIIRANLHSSLQRTQYFRAQEVFKLMGLMDENPEEMEIQLVREIMTSLKDIVMLKSITWDFNFEVNEEQILANYLLQGDKGYTIPEMFSILRAAELEFINMVNWRHWNLMALFKEPDNLPIFLAMSFPQASIEEQLHLFELLHPVHRLLDFWCGHPEQSQSPKPIAEWKPSDWQEVQVYLQPQLRMTNLKEDMVKSITLLKPLEISPVLTNEDSMFLDTNIASFLLPIWDESQSVKSLVDYWQKLRPVHPLTLEPMGEQEALDCVIQALTLLESFGYVLVERRSQMA
ncbi:MAG: class I SAM-dependent methyltransferase [Pelatocladus maniniholoensis HA4357-MV3]|jgi:2-polyprenyl-3-methyl-5-hydroxy-6-metoxy-1,4-benzoquinol methylase|uniref:Class I SAM-dependent methyltransferase n=1 Tax=Pelatocladus maniniholoensis HA4357-MV3 TaxID=1117104 RepID=A0A9E3HCD4_9NOST|nr:class I SAM-dependent methyltransferase [Pelatocladus maniniholoensis HA4357-MV3]